MAHLGVEALQFGSQLSVKRKWLLEAYPREDLCLERPLNVLSSVRGGIYDWHSY